MRQASRESPPHSNRREVSGFSLIELLITLVISVFLIGALILSFVSGRAAAEDAARLARMQENVRIISEYLVRDIRNAGYIDEVETLVGQDRLMRGDFAEILNGDRLIIRYAGRGHCGEQFDQFVLVQNEYFVDGEILMCKGQHLDGSAEIGDSNWDALLIASETVDLISGVQAIRFTPIDDGCSFNYDFDPLFPELLANSCLGVQIDIDLLGVRGDVRVLSLVAAFRNVIIERMNRGIPALSEES